MHLSNEFVEKVITSSNLLTYLPESVDLKPFYSQLFSLFPDCRIDNSDDGDEKS
jgi:hypothetical protein